MKRLNKPSGAHYKKLREEKQAKEENALKKVPRLDTFFTTISKTAGSAGAGEADTVDSSINSSEDVISISTETESIASTSVTSRLNHKIETVIAPPSPEIQLDQPNQENIPISISPSDISSSSATVSVSRDPAQWVINDATINYLLSTEISQNLEFDFSETKTFYASTKKTRYLTRNVFVRAMKNGMKIQRKYLCYSPSKKAVFCIPCRLFGNSTSQLGTCGYNDWNNVNSTLKHHEMSPEHLASQRSFIARSKVTSRVDTQLCLQIEKEFEYWRNVLRRVFAVVKKLSSRGLAFRGNDERFGSNHNGNYMMSLELIAEFDPFLSGHIAKYGNPGSGQTSYLSSTICDEFISLLGSKTRDAIVAEIKKSKYYSIIVDSTPDLSHVDELALILRYVPPNSSKPVERFLHFLPHVGHKAEDMMDALVIVFSLYDLNFEDCRGQSYDNAANMSGCYAGLQALVMEFGNLANYVPCSAHSLNLVGSCTVDSITAASNFFDYLEDFYNFLAKSTRRWEILEENLKPGQHVVKRVTGTRWSSRYNACSAFTDAWMEFMKVLLEIENNTAEKPENRRKAAGLRKKLSEFESIFIAVFWNALLERFESTNKSLQTVKTNLKDVVNLYKSLISFVDELRTDKQFSYFIELANKLIGKGMPEDEKCSRVRTRKLQSDESVESRKNEVVLKGHEKLKVNVYFAVLDRLKVELQTRSSGYELILQRFGFLLNICDQSVTTENLTQEANNFQRFYAVDIEDTFPNECIQFKAFLQNSNFKTTPSPVDMHEFIVNQNVKETFPNISTAIQIFLSMAVTNCSAERSFSCLKRLKNYLRSTMSESRLDDLALLNIEADVLEIIDSEQIITEFSRLKCRRKL